MTETTALRTEWTEYPPSTKRYERLVVERDGEELTIPISEIDHPEHPDYWDADRVYIGPGGNLTAETERDDGSVWAIQEDGTIPNGDISLAGHVVENPMDSTDDGQILWEREVDSEEISTDGGCLPEEGEKWRNTEEDRTFVIHFVDDTHVHLKDEGERYAPAGDSAGKLSHEEWKDAVEEYEVYERVEEDGE